MIDINEITEQDLSNMTEEQLMALAKELDTGYPKPEDKASIYSLFKKFFEAKDSTKIGNINDEELYAVRSLKNAATYCNVFNQELVSKYLNNKAENILASSMSKKFAFVLAAVTQKKFSYSSENLNQGEVKKKWGRKQEIQQNPEG
jgi:hypothetical protein